MVKIVLRKYIALSTLRTANQTLSVGGLSLAHFTHMMGWIGSELLMQAASVARDTIYMKQVASQPGWFEKVTGVASGVLTLTIIV